jgi:hypothetical protein
MRNARRCKRLDDALVCPMLAIRGRGGVRDGEEEPREGIEVSLFECDAERDGDMAS